MGLFLWDSEPSKIFVGDTEVSSVWVWANKVRPTRPTSLSYNFTDGTWSVSWAEQKGRLFYGDKTVVNFWARWLQRNYGTTSSYWVTRWGWKSPFIYKKFLDNINWLKSISIRAEANGLTNSTNGWYELSYLIYFFWSTVTSNWLQFPWNQKKGSTVRALNIYSLGSNIKNISQPSFAMNIWIYKYDFTSWAYQANYDGWTSWTLTSWTDSNLNQVKTALANWLYIGTWMDYIWYSAQNTAGIKNLSIDFERL